MERMEGTAIAKQGYFEGWYFKHQCGGSTVALIAAHHRAQTGIHTASLQVVMPERAYRLDIPIQQFRRQRRPFLVRAGGCVFSMEGCRIDCLLEGRALRGELRYQNLVPPKGDVMGPFRYVPGMQCRHSVFSLSHEVEGSLRWGDRILDFHHGNGYMEGDRGRSFPRRYLWTQCGWQGNSIMLSVADIPFCGGHFTGCICTILLEGREYRLATYYGARILEIGKRSALVRQGELELRVILEKDAAQPLRAPQNGDMTRTIYESAACRVRYMLRRESKTLFDFTGDQASFEAEWPEEEARARQR